MYYAGCCVSIQIRPGSIANHTGQTLSEILLSPYFIAALFFFVALAYSSVGLGGGSFYTALLAIAPAGSISILFVQICRISEHDRAKLACRMMCVDRTVVALFDEQW